MKSVEDRFWPKVDKRGEDECWPWLGGKDRDAYGTFFLRLDNNKYRGEGAHRVSYRLAYGDFDANLHVLHRCDNPPCVNPKHLFLGTNLDNIIDRNAKGRRRINWPRGDAHGGRKVCEADVREMRRAWSAGEKKQVELAAIYKITRRQVNDIIRNRSWRET